jgi:hypothetical protein
VTEPEERMGNLHHDIDENMPLQRRIWRLERIGWGTLILFVAGIFIGLFGKGPLSYARISAHSNTLQMRYFRFARVNSIEKLIFDIKVTNQNKPSIIIEDQYFKNNQIVQIMPEPDKVIELSGYYQFQFNSEGHDSLFKAEFMIIPLRPGSQSAEIGTDKKALFRFTQFVYP